MYPITKVTPLFYDLNSSSLDKSEFSKQQLFDQSGTNPQIR